VASTVITDPEQRERLKMLRDHLRGRAHNPHGFKVPAELSCAVAGYIIPAGATFWQLRGEPSTFYVTLESRRVQLTVTIGNQSVTVKDKSVDGQHKRGHRASKSFDSFNGSF